MTNKWSYNNFLQILYSCFRYTDRLVDVFFLLLTVMLSELYEKPRRKDLVTEKSTWKNLSEGHHIFGCTPSFLCHFFVTFFVYSLPLPKCYTCWIAPIEIHNKISSNSITHSSNWIFQFTEFNKVDGVMSAIENLWLLIYLPLKNDLSL